MNFGHLTTLKLVKLKLNYNYELRIEVGFD